MKKCQFAIFFFAVAVVAALVFGLPGGGEGEVSSAVIKGQEVAAAGGGTTCDGSREGWGLCWDPDLLDEEGNFVSRSPSYPCWCEESPSEAEDDFSSEASPPSSHAPPVSRGRALGFFRGLFRPKPL